MENKEIYIMDEKTKKWIRNLLNRFEDDKKMLYFFLDGYTE